MKTLSELMVSKPAIIQETQTDETPESILLKYQKDSPEFIGFPSIQAQEKIYEIIKYSMSTDLKNPLKILDLNALRGDLKHYLSIYNPSIVYKGYNSIEAFNDIAKQKYEGISIHNISEFDTNEYFDYGIFIGSELTDVDNVLLFKSFVEIYKNNCKELIILYPNKYQWSEADAINIEQISEIMSSKSLNYKIEFFNFTNLLKITI